MGLDAAFTITPARRRALDVLKAWDGDKVVHESNTTDLDARLVHWQVVEWLLKKGLVSATFGGRTVVALTDAGRALVNGPS